MAWDRKTNPRKLTGRPWRRLREQVLQRDKYLCQPCLRTGRYTEATEVDHVLGLAKGGDDKPMNLQAICTPCHEGKTLVESGAKPKQAIGVDGWPVHHGALGGKAYIATSRLGASSSQHGASVNQVSRNARKP